MGPRGGRNSLNGFVTLNIGTLVVVGAVGAGG